MLATYASISVLSYYACPTFRAFAVFAPLPAFATTVALLVLCFENRVFMLHMTTVNVDPTFV